MINSANHYQISDILKTESNIKYTIPRYQREYVWGKKDWENIFDDIWYNDSGHFLGSIICINRSDDSLQTQLLEIVDGQQRLTTLSLFYAAIYSWLYCQSDLNEELNHELFNLKHKLVFKSDKSSLKLELSYQRQNNQDYRAALMEAGILGDADIPRNAGNRRIFRTYYYFLNRLNDVDQSESPLFDMTNIQKLLEKINLASVVKIEVSTHSDAFTLFESLNNRGEPLSALDLIKNKLLAVLEKNSIGNIDDNFNRWNRLLNNLSDNYTVQERYLRQYYNAFKIMDAIAVPKISLATRSNIIHIYEKLIDRDAKMIFGNLYDKSELYNQLINPDNESNSIKLAGNLIDLDRIGGASSYTLLLYLLSEYTDSAIDEIAGFLVKYFVRRNLTDIPPTRDLDRLFIELIAGLHTKEDGDVPAIIRHFLTQPGHMAPDDVFRSKLEGDIYDENVGVTRFILCKIEESNQTKETRTDLWQRDDKNKYIWTVEHIFPQGTNIPDSWVDMIAGGDRTRAEENREQYVHKLGNLTLSGYNSKLGNKSFEEKRDRCNNRGRAVGYRNGLYLNEHLKDMDSWSVEDIKQRTEKLVETALQLFRVE